MVPVKNGVQANIAIDPEKKRITGVIVSNFNRILRPTKPECLLPGFPDNIIACSRKTFPIGLVQHGNQLPPVMSRFSFASIVGLYRFSIALRKACSKSLFSSKYSLF